MTGGTFPSPSPPIKSTVSSDYIVHSNSHGLYKYHFNGRMAYLITMKLKGPPLSGHTFKYPLSFLSPLIHRGNAILAGPHGQQLHSIAKFSLYLAGYQLRQLDCTSSRTFRSSLRGLFRTAGLEGCPVAAILTVS